MNGTETYKLYLEDQESPRYKRKARLKESEEKANAERRMVAYNKALSLTPGSWEHMKYIMHGGIRVHESYIDPDCYSETKTQTKTKETR